MTFSLYEDTDSLLLPDLTKDWRRAKELAQDEKFKGFFNQDLDDFGSFFDEDYDESETLPIAALTMYILPTLVLVILLVFIAGKLYKI